MKGLAEHTSKVFERISQMESIKPYLLVGGTALSLQIGKRQSEDLDFMRWKNSRKEKPEVSWYSIKREMEAVGTVDSIDILDLTWQSSFSRGLRFLSIPLPV